MLSTKNVGGRSYLGRMNTSTQTKDQMQHPEKGRRYTIEELIELADRGDAWAISRVDQWELEFGSGQALTYSERCSDASCEGYGEPVAYCCDEDGRLVEGDHLDWSHTVSYARAA